VYRNIKKSKDTHTYSVKGSDGKVLRHATDLSLLNPDIKVSNKGRERVRSEKQKNVHAGIKGEMGKVDASKFNWRDITYDPYKYETFVYRDDQKPVDKPDVILLTPKGAIAGFRK
jgi:cellobiose-specific phosphotransferase system component IIB